MGLANLIGQGYGAGYPEGYEAGKDGGGSPKSSPIRMVVGHHHTGDWFSGGGCYSVTRQCGATINWYRTNVSSPDGHPNQYLYEAWGNCANGHSLYTSKWSPTGVDPGEIRYQPCRNTIYALPSDHPEEGAFVRNVDVFPGQTPSGVLNMTANEKVTDVQKYQ